MRKTDPVSNLSHPLIDRPHVLAFRQQASHLDERLSKDRLVEVAQQGLQDSAPRSAVLSLHARLKDVNASIWDDPRLVQIWGPRGAVHVVPRKDLAVFTLGRLPRSQKSLDLIEAAMKRASKLSKKKSGSGLSQQDLSDLRKGSITGRVQIRWDGSRISWKLAEPPSMDLEKARLELAKRFLHYLGPSTPQGYAWWSGTELSDAKLTFQSLATELSMVRLRERSAWILRRDLQKLQMASIKSSVRLIPPGDPYLGSDDRRLLVPDAKSRASLWPKSVWPGALFETCELTGTWRRQQGKVTLHPWRDPSRLVMERVEEEVESMPFESERTVHWETVS